MARPFGIAGEHQITGREPAALTVGGGHLDRATQHDHPLPGRSRVRLTVETGAAQIGRARRDIAPTAMAGTLATKVRSASGISASTNADPPSAVVSISV
ncbi:hypothetical protein [Nocardia seriolae]|uniref:Uncharacterized protein n=1 Tax=Nocardia seriolae TaxID=37332 RepID=A0A0B8NGM1_9NOCA|nr:hypothetical protein [Nocardia seriolae]MTJ63312.1 hypothetical protein [Nocardia seriolae]MTJ71188.1 hypothetical protein [Nocardia seriolae]MTK32869.1 hypothetical protein [Nocardia seriolae]MTK41207.1 hypothetical protein [Nocardia seriolae]MTK49457.1 hypothetical protein [Nocardia seriolae]